MGLKIRYLLAEDHDQINKIYNKFFSDMEYPDFYRKFHCGFVVDSDDEIIAVGGLKPITEAIVLSNQKASVRDRRDALLQIYHGLTYAAEKLNYDEIHAFSFNDTYSNHLVKRMGFRVLNSQTLILDIKNGKKERT